MQKILMITDYYYPDPCANGVCLYEIANDLMKRNYEVHILSINNTKIDKDYVFDGVYVHSLAQDSIYYHLKSEENKVGENTNLVTLTFWKTVNKIRFLLETPLYPVTLPNLAKRYYAKLKSLHDEYNFSLYITMFHPIHATDAAAKLKKKHPNIKLAYYSLDAMTNDIKPLHFKRFKEKRIYAYEEKIHKASNLILNMKCHENHYNLSRFDKYRDKIFTSDFPLIRENVSININNKTNTAIVYSGTLYNIRNPDYACKCFSLIDEDFTLDFFSRGSCEHILEDYQKKTKNKIRRNGYIKRESLLEIIANSDFLLSIGNEGMEAIPSKIFEYISTLKPIIHFYKNDSDSCLPYLNKYPLVLTIKEDNAIIEENAKKISNFMTKSVGKKINYSDIADVFYMNTPQYTTHILEELLKGV